MSSNTRVMIVDQSGAPDKLLQSVRAQGFEAICEPAQGLSLDRISLHSPDLIVIDNQQDEAVGLDIARSLKASPETNALPLVMINKDLSEASQVNCLKAGADDVIGSPINSLSLGFRVRSLVRLEVMHAELMRRRNTMERFAIDVPPADLEHVEIDSAKVLVVGTASDLSMVDALSEMFELDREANAIEALGRIAETKYDAVVVTADKSAIKDTLEFCTDVRRNVAYFNLPILVILPPEATDAATSAHNERVSDVLFAPVDPLDLRQQVAIWIRHWRYRTQLVDAARETKSIVTIDPVTELSSHAFLHDYMTDLIAECEDRNRTFSLCYITVRDVESINREFGYSSGEHLLRQVGQIVKRLVRVEDLGSRCRSTEFCVLLPHTSPEDAKVVIDRVASVLRNTEMLLMGCTHSIRPEVGTAITSYQPGDSSESVLDRARASVK